MISVLGDDELRSKTEGRHASGKRAGGSGGHEGRLSSVVLAAELGPNKAPFDEAGLDVVELFGDFLPDEFELLFVFLVAFGKEGFFNDFELVPASVLMAGKKANLPGCFQVEMRTILNELYSLSYQGRIAAPRRSIPSKRRLRASGVRVSFF